MTALATESLSKSFGRTHAVRDVSLAVEEGQIFGLLGPNGSGKTTTLSCALGLLRPDRGRVSVLGEPSAAIHRTDGRVAAVFDTPGLVPGLTALQNLEYARRTLGHTGGRAADEALELVEMTPHARRRAGQMSLGQRRRLSIARALLGKPALLVLDEPLSGLDPSSVKRMLALFSRLRDNGITLVLSSHRLHEMEQIVTHVGVMSAGQLVSHGPLEELLGSSRGRVRVTAVPRETALGVLTGMAGVQILDEPPGADGSITVLGGDMPPAAINAALVSAGCAVSALVPERATLAALFDRIVEESA